MNTPPKISVITVVRNANDTIEKCIASVQMQQYPNVEHLIKDGLSTDGTVELIQKHRDHVSWFETSKDNGIFDAMNIAAAHASGDIVGFLNADDELLPGALILVAEQFLSSTIDMLWGGMLIISSNESERIYLPSDPAVYKPGKNWKMPAGHPSIFISKKLWAALGGYDLSFRFSSDYDLIQRSMKMSIVVKRIDVPLSLFRLGGASSKFFLAASLERMRICERMGMSRVKSRFFLLLTLLRHLLLKKRLIDLNVWTQGFI